MLCVGRLCDGGYAWGMRLRLDGEVMVGPLSLGRLSALMALFFEEARGEW